MDLAGCTYVEPYAGGAGAAISLLVTGQVEKIVINDLDPAIYAFWHTLTTDPDYMLERLASVRLDVQEWRRQREIYINPDTTSTAELGFATFFLNRTNRSGVLNGGPIGGHSQTGNYKIDARFNRATLGERMRIIALYAPDISVTCRDGVSVIQEYGRDSEAFIYADPPYFAKAGTLYLNAFETEDHAALADTLNALHDRNWLLTYDQTPEVARLYPLRRRRTFELHYSAHRVGRATEVAVLSDALPDVTVGWPST